jgi:hypothetical protein
MALQAHSIYLRGAADAMATALALEDPRLVRVIARATRMALSTRPDHPAGRRATQSLLLRQVERAAECRAFAQAAPILSAFRSAVG